LLDLALDALRRGAERHSLQARELELQLLGFQRLVDQAGLGRITLDDRNVAFSGNNPRRVRQLLDATPKLR